MRFTLRTMCVAVALVGSFLGGRASVLPLIREYDQQKRMLDQQLKTYEKLRPLLNSYANDDKLQVEQLNKQRSDIDGLLREIDGLRRRVPIAEAEKKARLVFPANTERAMLSDGVFATP